MQVSHNCNLKVVNTIVEEVKNENQRIYDPLSNPGFMTKPKSNNVERFVTKEETGTTFPSKRISARKQSDHSAEDLDNSPKNIFESRKKHIPVEEDFLEDFPYNYRGDRKPYQDFDTDEDAGRHNRGRGHYHQETTSSITDNFMNYLSSGVNIIKEKK